MAESLEHAGPRVERRSAVVLGAATDDDGGSFALGGHRELGAQPALPDAGLTRDHREDGMVCGLLEEAGECGQLVVAADQGPAELTRRRRGAAHRGAMRAPLRGNAGPLQPGVLAQYGGLQRPQLRTRLDPELVGQQLAYLSQHLQRVGLPTRPRQRQGTQSPQSLAKRIGGGQHLELTGHHGVPAQAERRDCTVLEGDRPQLLQPGALGQRGRSILELGVGHAAPERQRRGEVLEQGLQPLHRRPVRRHARTETFVGRAHRCFEGGCVQRVVGEQQRVAGLLGDQHLRRCPRGAIRLERTAQAGDVPLQRRGHCGRRFLAPQQVHDRVRRHRPSAVHRERGEQCPLLARAEIDRSPVRLGLGRSQDADAHGGRLWCGQALHAS